MSILTHDEAKRLSQSLSLDLLERLSKTLTRLGYATPEGGMEHFNADLANQLYNLCRAVDSLFDREQPPAPSDTAITYMTGYSDCKEWAVIAEHQQLAQAAQPERAPLSDEQKRILFECVEQVKDGNELDYYLLGFEAAERAHGIKQGGQHD